MSIKEVGKIHYYEMNHINWRIPQFEDLPWNPQSQICSPRFYFYREKKDFILYPVDLKNMPEDSNLHISVTFQYGRIQPINGILYVGVRDERGEVRSTCKCKLKHDDRRLQLVINSIPDSEIQSRSRGDPINGYLQLFCEILPRASAQIADRSTQTDFDNAIVNLSENLKDLYHNQKGSDLTINIQGRDFNVHRSILRARSEVFDAMLSHDFTENNENTIRIEDCDPVVFEDFLSFIYTGKTEYITSKNVFGLFSAADKYNLPDLRNTCLKFIQNSLSLENICEVICLAKKHEETDLTDIAFCFFMSRMDEILATPKWLLFLKENPVEANKLCLKGLRLGFKKR